MKSTLTLPEGYRSVLEIDLQKNKKLAWLVNLAAVAILIPMLILGHWLVPIGALFDISNFGAYLLRWAVLMAALVGYIVGHEWVHGIFMKRFCPAAERNFGFTGLYAYAGSKGFFCKKDYTAISLSPLVLWGLLFLLLMIPLYFLSGPWFWTVYFLQIMNVTGAAGDLYVSIRFRKLPENILVNDTGVSMTVFAPGA